jgi:hypothetical protein
MLRKYKKIEDATSYPAEKSPTPTYETETPFIKPSRAHPSEAKT